MKIGENDQYLKVKVVSYTDTQAQQYRGGQRETYVPMEVDSVACTTAFKRTAVLQMRMAEHWRGKARARRKAQTEAKDS